MPDIAIVFPHQLFESHPAVQECKTVALIESPLFFGTDAHHPIPMHWQKLLLHRASMKQYAKERKAEGKKVLYFEAHAYTSDRDILRELDKKSYKKWHLADPVDYMLSKRVDETAQACGASVTYYDSPLYINTQTDNHNFFDGRKRWFMADFYSHQRKRLDILVDEHGQPVGSKWSYDEDNRKKVPKKLLADIPDLPSISANAHTKAAADYVRDHYPNVIGVQNDLMYPYSREQAETWLQQFLVERFDLFGDYEDAIVAGENSLWHSLLTPMLNIGLLSPQYVVDMALAYALEKDVPLNSLEGFIRQIIGWREFMRASYESLGVQMRKGNHWQQKNKLPEGFWDGTTGIPPIDDCIQRILKTGYCH
ncbi:MAG: cryptochrome/photolyase family protein, partial [Bacteroidota bacterium]